MRGGKLKPDLLSLCEVLSAHEALPHGMLDTSEASAVAQVSGPALLAAARRGELKPRLYAWKLYWAFRELDAWCSDEAKAERKARKHLARRRVP